MITQNMHKEIFSHVILDYKRVNVSRHKLFLLVNVSQKGTVRRI